MRGDGYVYGIDCGENFTMYGYLQICHIVYIKHVQLFVCQSHLNKGIFKVYFK